ncbi:SLBB domain-containing protein [bacterium]|nr:SLBB domain-containing protein [bacterium]
MKKSLFSYLALASLVSQPVLAIDLSAKHDHLVKNNSCIDINNSATAMPSLISPGDTISYEILNSSNFDESNTYTFTIDPKGAAFLPGIGTTSFINVYEGELSGKLEQVYKGIMRNPIIDVLKVQRVSPVFTISGAVESPGLYRFESASSKTNTKEGLYGNDSNGGFDPTSSFFDVIKIAGGLTLNADTSNIFVYYQSKEGRICRKVNITNAILGQEWSGYVPVVNNMQIVVKQRKDKDPRVLSKTAIKKSSMFSRNKTLILFGQFVSPGIYKYDQTPSLVEIIAEAGGLSLESSKNIYIIPPSKDNDGTYDTKDIRIQNVSNIDQMTENIEFASGTVVYAPDSTIKLLQMRLSQIMSILNPLFTTYGLFLK